MFLPVRTLLACALAATVAAQAPFGNFRFRLPAGQLAAVDCITPDLNGDGLRDLVRASQFDFGIWLQDKAGRFHPVTFPKRLPTNPQREIVALAVGRVSSLRSQDILVAYRSGLVQVYPHAGGNFGAPRALPTLQGAVNPAVEDLLVGDLAGTAHDEIVVVLDSDRPVVYSVNGAGFDQVMPVGRRLPHPRAVLADLDLDKDLDLLILSGQPGAPAPPGLYLNQRGVLLPNSTAFGSVTLAASQLVAADVVAGGGAELVLTPASTNAEPVRVFRNFSTTPGAPRFAPLTLAGNLYTVRLPKDFALVDLNGDGYRDVLTIGATGAVTYGLSGGARAPLAFSKPIPLMARAPRSHLCPMDLEGDGDLDLLVAGAGIEDSLLLGGPRGVPILDLDTEDQGMPLGAAPRHVTALVDFTGEGDPDLVMWPATGGTVPVMLRNDGGQARFDRVPYTGQVPALPVSAYSAAHAAAVVHPGSPDVLVLGKITAGNATGVRVFVAAGGPALRDDSATRWGLRLDFDTIRPADVSGKLPGSSGSPGFADVVGVDAYGFPRVVFNTKGFYGKQRLLSTTRSPSGTTAHVADLNVDSLPDIVLVEPRGRTRVFLAATAAADTWTEIQALPIGGPSAQLHDFTGDLIPDLLLAAPAAAKRLLFFRGLGNGRFFNATSTYLANLPVLTETPERMATVAADGVSHIAVALGFVRGRDRLLLAGPTGVRSAAQLPLRGSQNTAGFLIGDLDVDGDPDLVVTRADAFPSVLLGQATDFCNVGVGQAGREALMRVAYPDLTTTGGLAIGFPIVRFPLGNLGLMRLARVSVILNVPAGARERSIRLPLPPTLGTLQIPIQLFTISGAGVLKLRNLDSFRPTNR